MDINDMTIGDAKAIATMFTGTDKQSPSIASTMIGKYVICRSSNEGINAGTVTAADDTGVVLKDVRRIWYHRPADKKLSWYEGVAQSGLSKDSKVSAVIAEKAIIEKYSLTLCTDDARQSIESATSHAQS